MKTTNEIITILKSTPTATFKKNSAFNTLLILNNLLNTSDIEIINENNINGHTNSSVKNILMQTHAGDRLLFSYSITAGSVNGYYNLKNFQVMRL